jgi:hypothetical protein
LASPIREIDWRHRQSRRHHEGWQHTCRRLLIEAAWSYRFPPRVGKDMQTKIGAAPRAAREIAWKAHMRLCGRFRTLTRKGKRSTIVVTAIARELSGFIWAISREVEGSHATANR